MEKALSLQTGEVNMGRFGELYDGSCMVQETMLVDPGKFKPETGAEAVCEVLSGVVVQEGNDYRFSPHPLNGRCVIRPSNERISEGRTRELAIKKACDASWLALAQSKHRYTGIGAALVVESTQAKRPDEERLEQPEKGFDIQAAKLKEKMALESLRPDMENTPRRVIYAVAGENDSTAHPNKIIRKLDLARVPPRHLNRIGCYVAGTRLVADPERCRGDCGPGSELAKERLYELWL